MHAVGGSLDIDLYVYVGSFAQGLGVFRLVLLCFIDDSNLVYFWVIPPLIFEAAYFERLLCCCSLFSLKLYRCAHASSVVQ